MTLLLLLMPSLVSLSGHLYGVLLQELPAGSLGATPCRDLLLAGEDLLQLPAVQTHRRHVLLLRVRVDLGAVSPRLHVSLVAFRHL